MDKTALLARRLPEGDVEIPGVGTFRVRGLSRAEVIKANGLDAEAREIFWLSHGIVDDEATEDAIRQWRESATFAEVELVADRIAELSGMAEESKKDATKSAA